MDDQCVRVQVWTTNPKADRTMGEPEISQMIDVTLNTTDNLTRTFELPCNNDFTDTMRGRWMRIDVIPKEPEMTSKTFLGSPTYTAWSRCMQDMQDWVRRINENNGWFETERPFSADVALLHSEVSEAYEGYRNNDLANVHEELADILIRLLDTCERLEVNLTEEFMRKCLKNANRGFKHGGKVE